MDFTFSKFEFFIKKVNENYKILSFENYLKSFKSYKGKLLILRHDVDRYPKHSLRIAKIENKLGISSTFYFRTINSVFKPQIIKEIALLGHEIGYHYEDLSICKGDYEKAIKNFEINLNKLRYYYPVKTICMHGSPLSPWDNKDIWKKYDYKNFGIILDTSLDINYNEFFYITDNGFAWNKTSTSVRDKVKSRFNIKIKSTDHLIKMIDNDKLPDKVTLNAHPDTFFDPGLGWFINFSLIKLKNIVKWFIVKWKVVK